MAETTIYLVLTEEYYGGNRHQPFLTLEGAQAHRDQIIAEYEGQHDVIIQRFVLKPGEETVFDYCE